MIRTTVQAVISLVLAGSMASSHAGPAVIGMVVAAGGLVVDGNRVPGNATLFDGTMIQTGTVSSELRLNNGARLSLGAGTRGRVYRDHLFLEQGEGQIVSIDGYTVRARGLRILPENSGSSGRIALAGSSKVRVTATGGGLRVTNSEGILVASLVPGTALEFEPQAAGAAAPTRLSGCVKKAGDRYFLTDETTNVTVELLGTQVPAEAGNRVEMVGSLNPTGRPAAEASQLIRVTEVRRLAQGCRSAKSPVAAGAAAGGAAGAAGGAGTMTTVAVVGGVAAAATVGGLAAAEKLPGQGDDGRPSASR